MINLTASLLPAQIRLLPDYVQKVISNLTYHDFFIYKVHESLNGYFELSFTFDYQCHPQLFEQMELDLSLPFFQESTGDYTHEITVHTDNFQSGVIGINPLPR